MTYPPQQPGPYGPEDPYGPPRPPGQPAPYGPPAGAPPGQQPPGWPQDGTGYGQHVPPGAAAGHGGWGQPPFGAQYPGQPYGTAPSALGQPGGYPLPPPGFPRRRSRLPWIMAGGGLVAVVMVAILVLVTAGGGGSAGNPRDTAQAYADAINDRKPDRTIYCDSYLGQLEGGTDLPYLPTELPDLPDLPELPEITLSASVGDVTQDGDTARAAVDVDTEFAGQKITATHTLTIKREGSGWKICDIGFGLPRLGGG